MKFCPHCGFDLGSLRPKIGEEVEIYRNKWVKTKVKFYAEDPEIFFVELHLGQAGPQPFHMRNQGKDWRRVEG